MEVVAAATAARAVAVRKWWKSMIPDEGAGLWWLMRNSSTLQHWMDYLERQGRFSCTVSFREKKGSWMLQIRNRGLIIRG